MTIGQRMRDGWHSVGWLICGLLLLVHSASGFADTATTTAAKTINVSQLTQGRVTLGASLDYLAAPAQIDQISDLIEQNATLNWQTQQALEPNFGFNPTPIRDKDCKCGHLRSQFDCLDKTVTSDAHTSRYYRIFLLG